MALYRPFFKKPTGAEDDYHIIFTGCKEEQTISEWEQEQDNKGYFPQVIAYETGEQIALDFGILATMFAKNPDIDVEHKETRKISEHVFETHFVDDNQNHIKLSVSTKGWIELNDRKYEKCLKQAFLASLSRQGIRKEEFTIC